MPSIALRDDSFPFLVEAGNSFPLEWNYGKMMLKQITAEVIHISKTNIRWFVFGHVNLKSKMRDWNHFFCNPTQNALCQVSSDNKRIVDSMLLFPSTKVDLPYEISHVHLPEHFLKDSSNLSLSCTSSDSNRKLDYSDKQYDVSLCDLIDLNIEFALVPHQNIMLWRYNNLSVTMMIIVTLTCLYFFTQVCQQLVQLLHGRRASFSHGTTTFPCIVIVYYAIEHWRNQTYLILEEEVVLQFILMIYILVSLLKYTPKLITFILKLANNMRKDKLFMHELTKNKQKSLEESQPLLTQDQVAEINHILHTSEKLEPRKIDQDDFTSIGTLIALQFLLTASMNSSYDNPFYDILCFMFGVRSFLKFLNIIAIHIPHANYSIQKILHTILDLGVFVCLLYFGLHIKSESDEMYLSVLSTVLLFSVLGGTILHTIAKNASTEIKRE